MNHSAFLKGENMVCISRSKGKKKSILPLEDDQKIHYSLVKENFPGCTSLCYNKNGQEVIVSEDEEGYCPPTGGWGDRNYYFKVAVYKGKTDWTGLKFYIILTFGCVGLSFLSAWLISSALVYGTASSDHDCKD